MDLSLLPTERLNELLHTVTGKERQERVITGLVDLGWPISEAKTAVTLPRRNRRLLAARHFPVHNMDGKNLKVTSGKLPRGIRLLWDL